MTVRTLLTSLAALAIAFPAPAIGEVKAIGRFKDWRVYTEQTGKELICYAAVEPVDAAPKNMDHGDVQFFVATWKGGRLSNQPSLKVGYALRSDINPEAVVGRERFRMFAAGDEAFVSEGGERGLLAAIKKGSELRIEAASAANARTAYHFSLKGSTEAIDKAKALCR